MNQNAAGRGDAVVAGRWYSDYRVPSTCCPLNVKSKEGCHYHHRLFSKFAPEEIVVQGPDPPSTSPSSSPQNNTAAPISVAAAKKSVSILSEAPQRTQPQKTGDNVEQTAQQNLNNKLLVDLHEAHELFHQIYTEAKALLRNNENSTSSEEVVAMADYFMILVNSLDLEKSLAMIQSLQTARSREKQEDRKKKMCENKELIEEEEGEEEVDQKLRQAVKSMSQLHHVFLTMVESAIPPNPPILSTETDTQSKMDAGDPLFNKEMYSALTVGRALQLSRRAVELGMPMHRPLYQRLATGTVLTSSPSTPSWMSKPSPPPADNASKPKLNEPTDNESSSLILPGQYQKTKEGLHTPPLVLELLGIYQHARSALQISGDQLHQLAIELLVGPLLLLLKQKQWNEAMSLLRGLGAQFGKGENIDLLGLLGESHTLDALEVVKGWLEGGTEIHEDVQDDANARELTNLLEVAVAEILRGRKQREEKLSHLLWQLSLHGNNDSDFDEESDSDSDFEDEFECDNDVDDEFETGATTPTPAEASSVADFASSSTAVRAQNDPQPEIKWHDGATVTLSFRAGNEITPTEPEIVEGKKVEESTIIKGLSDDVARQSIYLRNADWSLPDIVPTLEEWNKGNQLRFTPEFERYMMDESKEEDED